MKQSALVSLVLSDCGKRVDITADASAAVSNAILHYNRERFFFLETATAITTTASLATYALPSNLGGNIDSMMIWVSGRKQPMKRRDFSDINEKDDGVFTGQPSEFTVYGNNLRVWPLPDQTYTLNMSYQMSIDPPTLSGSNAWTNAGAGLIRARAAWDVWLNTMRNVQQATLSKQTETEEYLALIGQTTRRLSTGQLRKAGF